MSAQLNADRRTAYENSGLVPSSESTSGRGLPRNVRCLPFLGYATPESVPESGLVPSG